MHWFRKRARQCSKTVGTVLAVVWLSAFVAPCFAAMPSCDQPMPPCESMGDMPQAAGCEEVVLDCKVPTTNTPATISFDVPQMNLAVLTVVPATALAPPIHAPPDTTQVRPPSKAPTYLTHLSLLL